MHLAAAEYYKCPASVKSYTSPIATELCFDMSRFNSRLYRVYDFVRSLINHRENEGLLSYESTIRYARLPALGLSPDDKDSFGTPIREEHTEVFDVLDWLRIAKGVSSIIELQVFDRLVNPHNEERIAEYVESFGVEILDWRFLDMSLSVFDAKAKPRIRGLHLYSSGKRAAISHWLSDDGLKSLNNVRSRGCEPRQVFSSSFTNEVPGLANSLSGYASMSFRR